jgi:predicted nucleic acid-binding protein
MKVGMGFVGRNGMRIFSRPLRMVLVDTSVWVKHLRSGEERLGALLNEGLVVCHPFIVSELACGTMDNRSEVLSLLRALPAAVRAEHDEAMHFIEEHNLMGQGLGYVDVHLLASAVLSDVRLWTLDRKLDRAVSRLGLGFGSSRPVSRISR